MSLRKSSSLNELEMLLISPAAKGERMWLLLHAAAQVVHLFPLLLFSKGFQGNIQTGFTRKMWNRNDRVGLYQWQHFPPTFSEAPVSRRGWAFFLFMVNVFKLLQTDWKWIVVCAPSHDTCPTAFRQNCVQAHQDILSPKSNKVRVRKS